MYQYQYQYQCQYQCQYQYHGAYLGALAESSSHADRVLDSGVGAYHMLIIGS